MKQNTDKNMYYTQLIEKHVRIGTFLVISLTDVEVESCSTWNICSSTCCSISHFRGDNKHSSCALAKTEETLVPSLNNLTTTDFKVKSLVSCTGGVELAPLRSCLAGFIDRSCVVHAQIVSG